MTPPQELLFDLETLINAAQPRRILLLGNVSPEFLNEYVAQKALINQPCEIVHYHSASLNEISTLNERFDVGIVLNLFEHIEPIKGRQVLSRLRDVLTPQYCLALPLAHQSDASSWQLNDLFSFALSKVNSYDDVSHGLTLFKYSIENYKKTPDWLNADNWANPQLWGKYWW